MSDLAIFGGPAVIQQPFQRFNEIGAEEEAAVLSVLRSGVLSQFIGVWAPDFFGGPRVQQLERQWEKYFQTKHAVAVNSNTSGLMAALGAIGISPGDEVIVSPWTMSASATSILVWNAIPVFADIESNTFNLDPVSIEQRISPRTKAIVVSDIFGQAADLDAIMKIARKNGLKVIEDCAQAPGARYNNAFVGTIADIGVFSLNYHKHIHSGEGGVCVTNDTRLFERMQLIRNHAEAVVEAKGVADLDNMIGFNFRMTEIEAAIASEQLKKLDRIVVDRQNVAERLSAGLKGLRGLSLPFVRTGCTHVYYVFGMQIDSSETGIHKDQIWEALRAEGVPVSKRYVNVHLFPMYQKRVAYGTQGYPWTAPFYSGTVSYEHGTCPVAEDLNENGYLGLGLCVNRYSNHDVDLIIEAFRKVWINLAELRAIRFSSAPVSQKELQEVRQTP
ncbi:MAG: DegT/DnrJ/EryC1/StrS family aminotransferase [Spirochaetia bacterium]|nr:DegT/DnrJ/EryC1/StrS family aminotransferase [Spirochaetia bacterium]